MTDATESPHISDNRLATKHIRTGGDSLEQFLVSWHDVPSNRSLDGHRAGEIAALRSQ